MNLISMGVMNITPDSFSDGIENSNLEIYKEKFKNLKSWATIIDIGAESTAPFNDPISSEEEIERFEKLLFPLLDKGGEFTFSIDTYKIETFDKVAKKILEIAPKSKLIFNDVSGVIDNELLNYLKESPLKFDYVFCHNLAPKRELSSHHMDYTIQSSGPEVFDEVLTFFEENLTKLNGIKRNIIIDPCFGFSKTREQNQYLVNNFASLVNSLTAYSTQFIFGVSRKSFMRFPANINAKDPENQKIMDLMQVGFLAKIQCELQKKEIDLIVRSHSHEVFMALNNISSFSNS